MPVITPYTDAVLQVPGLIHYWPLSDTDGLVAADVVGANDGVYDAEVVLNVPSLIVSEQDNGAVTIDATGPPGHKLVIPDFADIVAGLTNFTFGLTIRSRRLSGTSSIVSMPHQADVSPHNFIHISRNNGAADQVSVTVFTDSGLVLVTGPAADDEVVRVVVVYDDPDLTVYCNGAAASLSGVGGIEIDPTEAPDLYIGGPHEGTTNQLWYQGDLDEVFVASAAVSSGDVAALEAAALLDPYQAQLAALPGMVSHWPLSEGSGTVAGDIVGDNDGSHVGTVGLDYDHAAPSLIPTEPGASAASGSAALSLSGGHVLVADDPSLQIPETVFAGLTIAPAADEFGVLSEGGLMQKGAFASYDVRLSSAGTLRFGVSEDGAVSPSGLVEVGGRYNVVGVYDGSAVSLYVNAEMVASAEASGSLNHDHHIYSHDLFIGAGFLAQVGVEREYEGLLDEVFLGSAVLPASAVHEMHVAAVGLKRPSVSTDAATSVASDSATMNGSVNPNQWRTRYWFEWGSTVAYGSVLPVGSGDAGLGSLARLVSEPLEGLDPLTTYHYRLVAENENGVTYGSDRVFQTAGVPVGTIPSRIGVS